MGFSRRYGNTGKSKRPCWNEQYSRASDTSSKWHHPSSVPHRHLLLKENSRISVKEGAKHNLPDADAQEAAEEIKNLASALTEEDILLVLISGKEKKPKTLLFVFSSFVTSPLQHVWHTMTKMCAGGGSALLPAPIPPISLQEKLGVTRKLAAAGATIQELNTVRRALSFLKGGGLACSAHPAKVTSSLKGIFLCVLLQKCPVFWAVSPYFIAFFSS